MNGYKKDYKLEKKFHQFTDLRELISESAIKYGDKTAFITKIKDHGDVSYKNTSYKDFYEDMKKLGTALCHRGFKDTHAALLGENSYRWVLSYVTYASGVGVTVPLDKALPEDELESCINRSKSEVIFYDKKHADLVRTIFRKGNTCLKLGISLGFYDVELIDSISIDELVAEGGRCIKLGNTDYTDAEIDPDVMSFLLFTSGTTAQSKAVMLSHRNLMSCNWGMNCEEVFFEDDINMVILPLHHIYGFSGLLTFISQGMTNVFCDGLKYIVKNMREYKVTVFTSVPLLLENMYKKIKKAIVKQGMEKKVDFAMKACKKADKVGVNLRKKMFQPVNDQLGGHLRFIINGASALDPEVSRGFNEFGVLTVQGYGLTETSPTIASETYRYLKPGSCGKIMPNVQASIVDPDEDGIGELVVKSDSVMLGYYEDQAATDEVIENGWFHTGDLAYIDEEGYLFITGRKKNVIVMKNGKNVFPEEIENNINLLPYVKESMVFTQPKATDLVLWAKVVYDKSYLDENNMTKEDLEKVLERDMDKINDDMPAYKMVKHSYLSDQPTIKTTTAKTKRNLEMKVIEEEIKELGLK